MRAAIVPASTASALAGLLLCALAAPARSHATLNERQVSPGRAFLTVRISHACDGSPTVSLRTKIPEGVTRVYPFYIPGWTITTKMRKLPAPIKGEGGVVLTETVDEITWTGGPIPDGLFAEFRFKAEIPDSPGTTLYFRTIQSCQKGEYRWVETPQPGEKDFDMANPETVLKYKEPAPFTKVVKGPPNPGP
jgi:uncharacterized protein YcnI